MTKAWQTIKEHPLVLLAGFIIGAVAPTTLALLQYVAQRNDQNEAGRRNSPSLAVASVTTFTPTGIGARSGGAQNAEVFNELRRLGFQRVPFQALTSRRLPNTPLIHDPSESPGPVHKRKIYVWLGVQNLSGDCFQLRGLYMEANVSLRPGYLAQRSIAVGARSEPICPGHGLLLPVAVVRGYDSVSLAEYSASISQEVRAETCSIAYQVKVSGERKRYDCVKSLEAEATSG
jgi:hypothetical protein